MCASCGNLGHGLRAAGEREQQRGTQQPQLDHVSYFHNSENAAQEYAPSSRRISVSTQMNQTVKPDSVFRPSKTAADALNHSR
jgi:hypothetical protein